MKTFLKLTALSAVLLMFAGIVVSCNEKEEDCTCMPFAVLAEGRHPRAPQQNTVVRTQDEWERFSTSPFFLANSFNERRIDFETYQIIVIIDDYRPAGGWRFHIECVERVVGAGETLDDIVVHVVISGGGVTDLISKPYIVIKTQKTIGSVEFEHTEIPIHRPH